MDNNKKAVLYLTGLTIAAAAAFGVGYGAFQWVSARVCRKKPRKKALPDGRGVRGLRSTNTPISD